jgi:hypothetical protein
LPSLELEGHVIHSPKGALREAKVYLEMANVEDCICHGRELRSGK